MCGVDVDVVKVIRLVLKLGGFTSEKESPDDFTGVGDAITAVFGAESVKFNALSKFEGFQARTVWSYKALKRKDERNLIYNPLLAPVGLIYDKAEKELGSAAFGTDNLIKPEWLLRRLIMNKWLSTLATDPSVGNTSAIPDWRVRGLATVDCEQPMKINIKFKNQNAEGGKALTTAVITGTFCWISRFRKTPGKTHMRPLFPSRV